MGRCNQGRALQESNKKGKAGDASPAFWFPPIGWLLSLAGGITLSISFPRARCSSHSRGMSSPPLGIRMASGRFEPRAADASLLTEDIPQSRARSEAPHRIPHVSSGCPGRILQRAYSAARAVPRSRARRQEFFIAFVYESRA